MGIEPLRSGLRGEQKKFSNLCILLQHCDTTWPRPDGFKKSFRISERQALNLSKISSLMSKTFFNGKAWWFLMLHPSTKEHFELKLYSLLNIRSSRLKSVLKPKSTTPMSTKKVKFVCLLSP